jgi:hypothetical protein
MTIIDGFQEIKYAFLQQVTEGVCSMPLRRQLPCVFQPKIICLCSSIIFPPSTLTFIGPTPFQSRQVKYAGYYVNMIGLTMTVVPSHL